MADVAPPPTSSSPPTMPVAPGVRPLRHVRGALALATSTAASVVMIWAASSYQRVAPAEASSASRLAIENNAIILPPAAAQWRHIKLGTATASTVHLTAPVPARVRVDERRATRVGVPFDGRVVALHVETGQRVRAGEALFSVSSPSLADLSADQERAGLDLNVARASLERVRGLVAAGLVPARDEIAALNAVKQAEVQQRLVGNRLKSVRAAGAGETEFLVRAPASGVVVEKNVLVGQEVVRGAADVLMVIADLSMVQVVADLFETDALRVAAGTRAVITSPAMPEMRLEGTVSMVSAVVDPQRHTIPVRILLANKDGALRPNLYARVQFTSTPLPGTVEIPASALVTNGSDQFVYVQAEPGRFSKRAVEAGSGRGEVVPVFKGITQGEQVVVEGALLLDNQMDLAL